MLWCWKENQQERIIEKSFGENVGVFIRFYHITNNFQSSYTPSGFHLISSHFFFIFFNWDIFIPYHNFNLPFFFKNHSLLFIAIVKMFLYFFGYGQTQNLIKKLFLFYASICVYECVRNNEVSFFLFEE